MKLLKLLALMAGVTLGLSTVGETKVEAGYYGGWNYHSNYGYHYARYNYGNHYHYCVYYPSRPRYVYYYNPYQQVYWGRFDLQGKEGAQYSLLKDEHKKGKLADIQEEHFPALGAMPNNPEGEGTIPVPPAPPKDAK